MNDAEPYAPAWRRMRRLLVANAVLVVALLGSVALPFVLQRTVLFAVCGAVLVAFLVANARLLAFRCPRCGGRWFTGRMGIGGPCSKCKLPWWARGPYT